jgi:hypothetical protein
MVSVGEREVGVVRFGEVDPALAEVQGLQGLILEWWGNLFPTTNLEIPMFTLTEEKLNGSGCHLHQDYQWKEMILSSRLSITASESFFCSP